MQNGHNTGKLVTFADGHPHLNVLGTNGHHVLLLLASDLFTPEGKAQIIQA